jgi:conjugal transfer pilin signal peptidase TrbI
VNASANDNVMPPPVRRSVFGALRFGMVAMLRDWWRYKFVLMFAAALYALMSHYLGWNITPSMNNTLVWIEHGATPKLNDLVIYRFEGRGLASGAYLRDMRFYKRVAGLPGATIAVDKYRQVSVNGIAIGLAKSSTNHGQALTPITATVVPDGYYFVRGDTQDSFDSRYEESGLVRMGSVIGVAHVIF